MVDVGFKTDKGLRRSNNEDACYVLKKARVFIVADGVGGNNSGEFASRTCVDEIANYVETHDVNALKNEDDIKAFFEDCIKNANYKILELSQRHEENRGMATTVVVAFLKKSKLYVFNIGDSRAYILHDGELRQITEDHTYVNSLVKAGLITEEEAETHENRNMITRAVGVDHRVETDFFVETISTGDRILLCTDGLYGEMKKSELIELLCQEKTMIDICEDLVETANNNGGSDNITLVVADITEEDIDE